jgi:peptidyl-Lys metalloendopeptidase
MHRNRLAVALLGLFAASSAAFAQTELAARLRVDRTWLGENDDLVARIAVVNTGDKAIQVPRWQLPGETLDGSLFEVRRDGEPVTYLGRWVKRAAPTAEDMVTIEPGQVLRGRTELTKHYDMVDGGEYTVSYRMDVFADLGVEELKLDADIVESNAVSVWREARVREPLDRETMARWMPQAGSLSFTNCSSSQQSGVTAAFSAGTNYATGSKNYMLSKTYTTVGPRYTTWFGTSTSSNFNTVRAHFVAIEDAFLNKPVVVDCGCTQNYFAYVYPTQPYKIYVCNAFWAANNTGTDSRGGTLVHEMSHFNVVAGTDDWAYGKAACQKLAKRAAKAIDNADSHEYFAENTPALN